MTIYRYYLKGCVPVRIIRRKLFKKDEYKITTKTYECGCAVYARNWDDAYEQFCKTIKENVDRDYGADGLEVKWEVVHDTGFILGGGLNEHYNRTIKVESYQVFNVRIENQREMTWGMIFSQIPQTRLEELFGKEFTIKF